MNNPLHYPLSTTHKDNINFNFHPAPEKHTQSKKKLTNNKVASSEQNRSSKKKINSARNDNNMSVNNHTSMVN